MLDGLVGRVACGLSGRRTGWGADAHGSDRVAVKVAGRAGAGGLRASRIADGFVVSRGVDRIADGQDGGEAYVVVACLLAVSLVAALGSCRPAAC